MAARRSKPRRGGARTSRLGFWSALAILVLFAAYLAVLEYGRPTVTGEEFLLTEYVTLLEQGRVVDARILDQDGIVEGTYERDDGTQARYHVRYFQSENLRETLADLLISNGVPFRIDQQFAKSLVLPATMLLPALILVVIFVYLILSYRSGSGLFGVASGARKVEPDETTVTFADVAGQAEATAELQELSAFLADPDRFAAVGAQIPKGVLLYGPPGCGKTLMARALAGEAGAAFYTISGSDFVELYAGVGASRVRELFRQAREHAPAIVFIDELDSVGRRRTFGSAAGASMRDEQEQALNQILAEMDGFSPSAGIIVLGATNRPDALDPALLRPGRFDRTIGLDRVDEAGRLDILRLHARGKPLADDADLAAVARRAIGLTGADLANVMNEAALLTARAGATAIGQAELDAALTRILEAPDRQRRLSLRERGIGRRAVGGADRVTFADVAGVDDAVAELAEVRDYLAHPERFAELGARVPRGVLLTGPPGAGKTLLAKAVAGEANAAFFSASAPEFVEVFVGQGATRVRDLFADAAAAAPAIVFIDEIDAVGARRGADVGSSTEREQTLNQILVALDGFEERTAVIVIAATNRPDILDPALVRPGRFDRQVAVALPDRAGRREILALHAAGKRLAADVDLDVLAGLTPGFSGADLANVLNEAALLAARRGQPAITRAGIEEAVERALLGVASRATVLSEAERSTLAYHEAGHALVGRALPAGRVAHKLSLVAGGKALGFTWQADGDGGERTVHSRSGLLDEMATLLGGRVAEQLAFGEAGTAAADDLGRATAIAQRMVTELGMSDALGPRSYVTARAYSADAARRIDAEIDALLGEAFEAARRVLAGQRAALDRVAEALLARETLTGEEFEALAAGASARRSRADAG